MYLMKRIAIVASFLLAVVLDSSGTFALAVSTRSFTHSRLISRQQRCSNQYPQQSLSSIPRTGSKNKRSSLFFRTSRSSDIEKNNPHISPTQLYSFSGNMSNFSRRMLGLRGGSSLIKGFLDDVASSKAKSWAVLFTSILIENAASTISKRARDTSNPVLFLCSVCMNLISICGFCTCLGKIDVGVAYAVWAALGTVIVSTAGIVLFNERASPIKLISILLVIVGVVGLNLSDSHS